MGSATDTYSSLTVPGADWSSTVIYHPASGATGASVQVGVVSSVSCVLSGTVSAAGNTITLTVGSTQTELYAVADTQGGSIFMDGSSTYYFFSSSALFEATTYPTVAGFGHFEGGAACFAAGTRIATQRGMVPVERLRPGDRVRTVVRGAWAPVTWTGSRRIRCAAHPDPHAVLPIRIAAHAFAPGQPARDLRLSPEHAVFVDGVLVPIRQLVNDASIAQVAAASITYWHVELPAHDVMLADGLPAESFLDTGNRGLLRGAPARRVAGEAEVMRRWRTKACAPLATDPDLVNAIGRRLRQRARHLGFAETHDAWLTAAAGQRDCTIAWDGTTLMACLPARGRTIRLTSRTGIPAREFDGSLDARRLGVAVTRIVVDGSELPLADLCLTEGWHRPEPGLRWTQGPATMTLPAASRARPVRIETAPMLRYWRQ